MQIIKNAGYPIILSDASSAVYLLQEQKNICVQLADPGDIPGSNSHNNAYWFWLDAVTRLVTLFKQDPLEIDWNQFARTISATWVGGMDAQLANFMANAAYNFVRAPKNDWIHDTVSKYTVFDGWSLPLADSIRIVNAPVSPLVQGGVCSLFINVYVNGRVHGAGAYDSARCVRTRSAVWLKERYCDPIEVNGFGVVTATGSSGAYRVIAWRDRRYDTVTITLAGSGRTAESVKIKPDMLSWPVADDQRFECWVYFSDGDSADVTTQAVWGGNSDQFTITNGTLDRISGDTVPAARVWAGYGGFSDTTGEFSMNYDIDYILRINFADSNDVPAKTGWVRCYPNTAYPASPNHEGDYGWHGGPSMDNHWYGKDKVLSNGYCTLTTSMNKPATSGFCSLKVWRRDDTYDFLAKFCVGNYDNPNNDTCLIRTHYPGGVYGKPGNNGNPYYDTLVHFVSTLKNPLTTVTCSLWNNGADENGAYTFEIRGPILYMVMMHRNGVDIETFANDQENGCLKASSVHGASSAGRLSEISIRISPNPFNPSTTILCGLPRTEDLVLEIYNVTGEKVAVLSKSRKSAGYHAFIWNGRTAGHQNAGSGIYCVKMRVGENIKTQRILFLK